MGASENPSRYSNIAIRQLRAYNHPVLAIGKKPGEVAGVTIYNSPRHEEDVDTITLYLNQAHQKQYYDYIFSLNPKRIIFNPGAENSELASLASNQGIQPINACTLVMLSTGQY